MVGLQTAACTPIKCV